MKKLILVTALAVAASWLLSEPGRPGEDQANLTAALDQFRANDVDIPSRIVIQQDGETPSAPIRPARPLPTEPPPRPGSIRTVPWNKRASAPTNDRELDAKARKTPMLFSGRKSPAWFPKDGDEETAKARPDASGLRVIVGRLSASPKRARDDLRATLEGEVSDWLASDVPPSWKPPAELIDGMILGSHIEEVTKDLTAGGLTDAAMAGSTLKGGEPEAMEPLSEANGLYTLYRAGQKLDFSPTRRAEFNGAYRRELAASRLRRLGGGVALALAGLAVLSGYIKADEATKGYYTNRLRLLAGAGLGTAGVAAYRFLV